MFVAIFLLGLLTFVITNRVVIAPRVVDKIDRFLEVARSLEYFDVRPFIKSLLVHGVRFHEYSTVPRCSIF